MDIELKPEVIAALEDFADTCHHMLLYKVYLVVVRPYLDHTALFVNPVSHYSHLNHFFPEHYLQRDSFLFLFSMTKNLLMELDKQQYLQQLEWVADDLLRKDVNDLLNETPQMFCPPTARIKIEQDTIYMLRGEEANNWDLHRTDIRYVVPEPAK